MHCLVRLCSVIKMAGTCYVAILQYIAISTVNNMDVKKENVFVAHCVLVVKYD